MTMPIRPGMTVPLPGPLHSHREKLGELADLGVTALYLTPVFASASNHRYHTYDYLQVDPMLGGDAALRELIDAAHARGMRVVLEKRAAPQPSACT